jgi:hypothetical protein
MLLLYWLLVTVMILGVIGAAVPALPGVSLILVAIVIWGLVQGFSQIWIPLAVAIVVLLANLGIDFLAAYYGAKKAGASRWGQIGAIVGLLVGVFGLLPALPFGGPLLGLLIGPLLGAIVGELLYQRDLKRAFRAAIGIFVGTVVGNIIELLLAIVPVVVFLFTTWPQVYG